MEELRAELERVDANAHQAPIDISMVDTRPVPVADLEFLNYGNAPVKMKLNNTGYTVTVSGKFDGDPPTLRGGPLDGPFKFSQLHFHWGPSDSEGSEHTFEGRSCPLEMHMVHVNQKYSTQEEALLQKDGVVIVAFLFISGAKHPGLEGVARGLAEVSRPHTSFKIPPQALQSLCAPFQRDYFSYWGSVISPSCSHLIHWLVCRNPIEASPEQFAAFRQLLNVNEEPLVRNYRDVQALGGRTVFHLAPGSRDGFTLHCSPQSTCASAGDKGPAPPGQDTSALNVEQPCTSITEADSKGGLNMYGEVQRTESGREVVRTPSGRLLEKTDSGRLVERTPSGRLVERTDSGRLLERTPSGRLVERTPSGHQREVVRTPSGRLLEKTDSGRLVERTASGRTMERTESGRLLDQSRQLPPTIELTPSGHELTRTPSGRLLQKTASGRELERTPSGRLLEVSAASDIEGRPPGPPLGEDALGQQQLSVSGGSAEGAGAGAADDGGRQVGRTPSGTSDGRRALERTPSGRLPGMGSRVVSFSQITGPIKERSDNEWPATPFTGAATASPVFLDTAQAVRMPCPPLEFLGHFQTGVGLVLTNSGETVEISLMKAKDRPVLQGGPLKGRYILDSAHFHWLPNEDAAAGTHTINNARAEIECHLVHIHEDYKSKTEAMDHPNGLCVVSVLHQVGGAECEVFRRLCRELPRIQELYTQVEMPALDLSYMAKVVKPHEYLMYPGRFFGRDDGKALVWIVFPQPIGICCQNVAAFRSLRLSLDFRQHDTYPLGERPLYAVIADGGGVGDGTRVQGEPEELQLGALRRTASGRVRGIAPDEWPNVPFASKHPVLMAPLDIQSSTVPSIPMPPLQYRGHFPAASVPVELRNTGEAVDLMWKGGAAPSLVGGPLTEEYVFDSAHFHWAQNPEDVGAMHRVNGKRCDLEFHMVHYKKSLGTRQDAMFESDGLAVTSFLIQVGGQEDESFGQLTDALPAVKEVDAATELSIKMDWLKHRAGPHGFFTYPGTLFGADQGINVVWMVYPTPVQICCQHIARFYKLDCLDYERVHPLYEPLDRPMFHAINPDNCAS
ncbi:Carbonic anhydrase [Frankliniella fusca]|uniref:Carbonic anhydrase n=1 Tax=Frankliniella fusca TaxID=407009 RepID=A0AAE1HAT6_9NEOP|nr:Carbonic anhydrase [Frankliniella fusca]